MDIVRILWEFFLIIALIFGIVFIFTLIIGVIDGQIKRSKETDLKDFINIQYKNFMSLSPNEQEEKIKTLSKINEMLHEENEKMQNKKR